MSPTWTNMHDKADEVLRTSGQKALADGQPDHQPKPSPSEDVNVEERHLDEPENAHYVEDARPYDFAFMSFVSDGTFHGTLMIQIACMSSKMLTWFQTR